MNENLLIQERYEDLARIYRDGLLDDVLPFWLTHAIDSEFGGVMTAVDRDGTILDTDKSVWAQGRFTWLLGELYNDSQLADHPRRTHWLDVAERNLEFMSRHCFDVEDGRMWFHVTRSGEPIRKRRYAFTESFAAIAFGELAQATGKSEYMEQAESCFDRFVHHTIETSGFPPKQTATRPSKSIGIPMITLVTAQELRNSIGLESADQWIERSIAEIRSDFIKPDLESVMETVSIQGDVINHFDGRTLNPGHAIECAWFMMAEGKHRNDASLVQSGLQMLDWMWHRGWDREFGGLLYFVDLEGLPVQEYWHDMKFWWPHNEVLIATLMAYQLTRETKYAEWHQTAHEWVYGHFPDREFGEWFGYLNRAGKPTQMAKGNLWKGPFHLPRMQLLCWRILRDLANDTPTPSTSTDKES